MDNIVLEVVVGSAAVGCAFLVAWFALYSYYEKDSEKYKKMNRLERFANNIILDTTKRWDARSAVNPFKYIRRHLKLLPLFLPLLFISISYLFVAFYAVVSGRYIHLFVLTGLLLFGWIMMGGERVIIGWIKRMKNE